MIDNPLATQGFVGAKPLRASLRRSTAGAHKARNTSSNGDKDVNNYHLKVTHLSHNTVLVFIDHSLAAHGLAGVEPLWAALRGVLAGVPPRGLVGHAALAGVRLVQCEGGPRRVELGVQALTFGYVASAGLSNDKYIIIM